MFSVVSAFGLVLVSQLLVNMIGYASTLLFNHLLELWVLRVNK